MIPNHTTQYVEAFFGSGAVFWAKKKSPHEVINDSDQRVTNFFEVCRSDFDKLQHMVQNTLHSEVDYHKAKNVLLQNEITDKVEYAWAFWVQTTISFSNKLFGGFAHGNDGRNHPKTTRRKRDSFDFWIYDRLKDVEIFNRDAIDLILLKDNEDTFMFFDPPYPESHCGHYEKSKEVYYRLLEILPTLKCKWLLTSYPSDQLTEIRNKYNWNSEDKQQSLGVSGKDNEGKKKIECRTWNYEIKGRTISLFD